jgi:ABC-type transport system involved in multi-copper enzyme maturation permease subunit
MLFLRLFGTKDTGVFFLCSLLGLCVSVALRPFEWAPYVGSLVCFHFFVGYLILTSQGKAKRTYNLGVTIAGHLICVALLVGIRLGLVTTLRDQILSAPRGAASLATLILGVKFFAILMVVIIYAIAKGEISWLFSGGTVAEEKKPVHFAAPLAPITVSTGPLVPATGSDHQEWVKQRSNQGAVFYKPGTSPKDDFENWLRERGKTQYTTITGQMAPPQTDFAPQVVAMNK